MHGHADAGMIGLAETGGVPDRLEVRLCSLA